MDFHTLSRRELQTLCKKNKIPANITNVAMADALSALPQVEGLDEILNPREGGDVGTPAVKPRTACRTSTQRKPVKESQSAKVSTRVNRGAKAGVAEGVVEQENKDANVPVTPAAVPSGRRRAPAVCSRRKKEVIVIEDGDDDKTEAQGKPVDVAKTPAVAPTSKSRAGGRSLRNKNEISEGTTVQKAYSTRRSVRLLGSSLSKMSLVETEDTKQTKTDDVSEEMSSVSQYQEASVTGKGTSLQTESTVVSQNTDEVEVSSVNKADFESQSHDSGSEVKSTDAEDVLQAEPEEETSEEVNHVEAAQEDPSLNLQDSFETCVDINEAESKQHEIEESYDADEIEIKESFVAEQGQAVEFAEPEEASMEVADETITPLTGDEPDDASIEVADQAIAPWTASEPDDASMEVADHAIAPLIASEPEDASVDVPDQEVVANLSVEVSEEASKQTTDQAIVSLSIEASEESAEEIAHQASAPLNVAIPEDTCVYDADKDVADMSIVVSEEVPNEIADEAIATRTIVVRNGAMETSSEEHQVEEVLESKPEDSEQFVAETEKIEGSFSAIRADKDETSGGLGAENEKESNEVEKVILQLSMLDVAVKKEDQKGTVQSEELVAVEDTKSAVVAQINDEKIDDTVIESVAQSETKESANEIQAVPRTESSMFNPNVMKENLKTIDANMSIRELKKMLKQKLDGNSNIADNGAVQMQEVEKKRTALQALPQNGNCDAQMAE
ncbi:uncharacterized protein LOC123912993 [Trifolium pratense]|uniref:uncharacterized protein LOC123912993 n=1 Tax=Trifolium pratense TaxID=57577 RepID=UPI001E6978E6|nr:uncharacterized protein LOC123912993 [Trifolium pratense]